MREGLSAPRGPRGAEPEVEATLPASGSERSSGRRARELVLFVRPGCQTCEEVEDRLHEHGVEVERRVVRPSPIPGELVVAWRGRLTKVPKAAIPSVPSLWIVERGELHVGDTAIFAALRLLR